MALNILCGSAHLRVHANFPCSISSHTTALSLVSLELYIYEKKKFPSINRGKYIHMQHTKITNTTCAETREMGTIPKKTYQVGVNNKINERAVIWVAILAYTIQNRLVLQL